MMRAAALTAAVAWSAAEAALAVLVRRCRRDFPWLVTPRDAAPDIPAEVIERHMAKSFDAELGWCRRPNERGTEATDLGTTTYRTDERGRRHNPGFQHEAARVACFGDSFVFCRLVDDEHTWPHLLARWLGVNVANYGVGNYGLDQALLRFERELPTLESSVVVMGVVPETIARVHSYWKHYFEYGNVLAFKPRFTLDTTGLRLHPSAIRSAADYHTYTDKLSAIRELDPFYEAKFRRDMLSFPYTVSILRRARRHVPLLAHLVRGDRRRAFDVVLRDNARWTARLYADPKAADLVVALVERFAAVCRSAGKHPVLLVIPQLADLMRRDGGGAHEAVVRRLRETLPVVDVTGRFRADPDRRGLFTHGRLGPHCSPRGNAVVAAELRPVVAPLLSRATTFG
jgi:hypothetical protein